MPISLTDLAKRLEIAPEAVTLHAMELDFEVPEDEMLPDDIAAQIEKVEVGDEMAQVEHEIEGQMDREIVEKQQEATAGKKKIQHKAKKDKEEEKPVEILVDKDGGIILGESITVRELATKISKPLPIVLIKLKASGVIANPRQEIDYETAAIVAEDMGVKVKKEAAQLTGKELYQQDIGKLLADEDPSNLIPRPPVVSIMGHIDHGKTSLLDYIRKTKVTEGEAGGITQKIGAYQVDVEGKKITFLDTPGHEAFTTMRARGAKATDIAILVVAATDGIMPQTIEAINHARAAEIPIIVAINKMDMDGANLDQVKGQLAEQDLNPEDWGGDVPCIPISAHTGLGIDKLLETIQIVAELQEMKANPNRKAIGTILEATLDPKAGIFATVLVNTGTLKKGDAFVVYDQYGKIRTMRDYQNKDIKEAGPSVPVQISGFDTVPHAGDILQAMESEKIARRRSEEVAEFAHTEELKKDKKLTLEGLKARLAEGKLGQLKVIVKAESKGALEAVVAEVEKVKTEQSLAKVVHSGVGEITESDIMLAAAGDTIVVGFATKAPGRIQRMAEKEHVQLLNFDVIYHLTEKLQEILEGRESADEKEEIIGEFKIKAVFASNKKMAVIGGEVVSGKVRGKTHLRQYRMGKDAEGEEEEQLLGTAKVDSVQKGQEVANEISEGAECGMKIEHKGLKFEEGDRIELFVAKK